MGAFLAFGWLIAIVLYVYISFSLQTIADKTSTENGWFAWIPILNIILMCDIARKPWWWILLLFLPLVNIIVTVMLWMGIAESRGKPSWLGILILVPLASLILPGYLAFSS